jgi:hypothetical protein
MDQSDFLLECLVSATFCFLGALLFYRSKPWAQWFNALSVSLYQRFPRLKKMPRSRYAGSDLNYKVMFIWFRICGAFMFVSGIFFLALTIRIFSR